MSAPIRMRPVVALLLLALALPGCLKTYNRKTIIDGRNMKVSLRSERGADSANEAMSHPATISSVRVASILSRIDIRDDKQDGVRRPAIPTEILFPISEAVPKAFAEADPTQKVVVRAMRTSRRLGVFTERFMTGLVLWMQGDDLVVNLTHLDFRLNRGPQEKVPEPFADRPTGAFRVIAGPSMVPVASNTLLVSWKDPLFRKSSNLRVEAGGRVIRREILLEESPSEAPEASSPLPDGLTPETLRALADLEEARRSGKISEGEYQRRRRDLMAGQEEGP